MAQQQYLGAARALERSDEEEKTCSLEMEKTKKKEMIHEYLVAAIKTGAYITN